MSLVVVSECFGLTVCQVYHLCGDMVHSICLQRLSCNMRDNGGARLSSDANLALLSEGDVVLNGNGPEASYFQGTVFTKSGVQAEDLTVVGTLIAAGRNDSVTLENARVFVTPVRG